MEYRICWSSFSNITFRGATDWMDWGGDEDATEDEISEELSDGGGLCQGLEEALNGSGFEWWAEIR